MLIFIQASTHHHQKLNFVRSVVICKHVAPRAATRVRSIATSLGANFIDLNGAYHSVMRDRNKGGVLLREYLYTIHPSRAGSCVAYHALAATDPRLPDCGASCSDILRHTSVEHGHYSPDTVVRGGLKHQLEPLPPRIGHARTQDHKGCLTDARGATALF